MEVVAAIIGIAAICFLLVYILFSLDPEHFLLKLLLLLMFLVCLHLMPKVLIDNADNCEIVLNSTVEDTSILNTTTTTHQYTQYCVTNTTRTYTILYSFVTWIWRLVLGYMVLFLTWRALLFLGFVVPTEQKSSAGKKRIVPYKIK